MNSFCLEALVSGVLLAGNIGLVNDNNGLVSYNDHTYVLNNFTSRKELCKTEERIAKVPDIKGKIFLISSGE